MTVTVYTSTDTSAPVMNGTAGSLITLLNACLVNGYGSKSAAGFTSPYTGTNTAVYKAGSGNAFPLLVTDTAGTSAQVIGYESMTSISAGTNPFPTTAQLSGGVYILKSSTSDATSRPWLLVTNGTIFHLWVGYTLTLASGIASSAGSMPMFTYGDFVSYKSGDAYNTCIMGGSTTALTGNVNGAVITANAAQAGHYIVRQSTQIGTSIPGAKVTDVARMTFQATSGAASIPYPDPITGGLLLGVIEICDYPSSPAVIDPRGKIPGFYAVFHNLPGNCGDSFPGSGTYAGKTFMLLDAANAATRGRIAIETSNTW